MQAEKVSIVSVEIHMAVEKMRTYERVTEAKTIIAMLVTTLLSLIIIWGSRSLQSYGISQKKEIDELNWTIGWR